MSSSSPVPFVQPSKINTQPWIDSSHPRIKKILGSDKSSIGKLRQLLKIEKEESPKFEKRLFRVLHDNIFQNMIDALMELNEQAIKEAKAKQNFWGFMKQKNVKESDVELVIWCLQKLLLYESDIIKEGWEEKRLFEFLCKFLVHFNRYSIRIKVFKILIQIIELRFPDTPSASGNVYQQAELLCRVPLVSTAGKNNDDVGHAYNNVSSSSSSSSDDSDLDRESDDNDKSNNVKKGNNLVPRKYIFQTLKEFETKTSKGDSFLDYCSKRWSLPGKNVVETQNQFDEIENKNRKIVEGNESSKVLIPLHGYLNAKSFDVIIKSYERLHPFLSLLIASFDWTPWYNNLKRMAMGSTRDDSLNTNSNSFNNKRSKRSHVNLASYATTFPFLIAVNEYEQSSKENVRGMLNYLLQYVGSINHLEKPDILQFWYFVLHNYLFPTIYPSVDFGARKFTGSIIKGGQKLSSKCLLSETPHELQLTVVNFLTESFKHNFLSRLIVGDIRRTESILEIFNLFISTPTLVCESQAPIIFGLYRSWIIGKENLLTRISPINKVQIHINMFITQACTIIGMSKLCIQKGASSGFDATFSETMNLLKSISTSNFIYTREFQSNVQRLLHIVAKVSRNTSSIAHETIDHSDGHYLTRSTLAVFKLLVLTKRLDFATWSYVYSEMPGILINPAAVKAVGIVLVCLTRTILKMSYKEHEIQIQEDEREKTGGAKSSTTPKVTTPKSATKTNANKHDKKMHARLNFSTSIITSFNISHLKYSFESAGAAYEMLDETKTKTNYWDDENNHFYQALYALFYDDDEGEVEIGDKDNQYDVRNNKIGDDTSRSNDKTGERPVVGKRKSSLYGKWATNDISNSGHLFILWDRLLHVFSCGKHCEIWKSSNHPKGFETIVIQIIYMVRSWLRVQDQVSATYKQENQFATPLVSTVIDLFGPWLLNACLHDFEEHLYDYSGAFEGGKALAFAVICIIISIRTDEIISRERLFEIYSCIGYGLSFADKTDLAVIHSILSHSTDIFSTGHDGVSTLMPSYLYAIDCLMNTVSVTEYQALTKHLRCSIISILSCIFCHSSLFAELDSNALVNSLLTRNVHINLIDGKGIKNKDKVNETLIAPKYLLRLSHSLRLLLKILNYESDPYVMSQIMHTLSTMFQHETKRVAGSMVNDLNMFEHMALKDVLYDDALRAQLKNFSKKEYSDENIDFWTDVEKFHALSITASYSGEDNDLIAALELGKFIHSTYIQKDADREVNIPATVSDSIQSLELTSENDRKINISFFATAQQEIYDLIERDTYPRFLSEYNNFHNSSRLHIINAYIPIIESACNAGSDNKSNRRSINNVVVSPLVIKEALSSLIFIGKELEQESTLQSSCKAIVANVIDSLANTILKCAEILKRDKMGVNAKGMWSIVQKIAKALKIWTMLQHDNAVVERILETLSRVVEHDMSLPKTSKGNNSDRRSKTKSSQLSPRGISVSGSNLSATNGNNGDNKHSTFAEVRKTPEELKAIYETQATASHLFRYFKAPKKLVENGGYYTNIVETDTDYSKALFFAINNKIFSISELPLVNGSIERSFARIIMRDASGKFSWDFDYLRDIKRTYGHVPLSRVSISTAQEVAGNLHNNLSHEHSNSSIQDIVADIVENVVHENNNSNEDKSLSDMLVQTYAHSDIPKSSSVSNRLEDLVEFIITKFDDDCIDGQKFRKHYNATQEFLDSNVNGNQSLLDRIEEMGNNEKDRFNKFLVNRRDSTTRGDGILSPAIHEENGSVSSVTTFDRCRQFLSDIGFIGANQLSGFLPLEDNKRLRNFLRSLDRANPRHTLRVGVVYVGEGQTTQVEIMQNQRGSLAYDKFVSQLGRDMKIEDLLAQGRYTGGLDAKEHIHALYYDDPTIEIIYHVMTWLPLKENDKQQIRRKRHIGNDTVHIVWCDNERAYDVRTFVSKVTDIFIVLLPICPYSFRANTNENKDNEFFIPRLLRVEIYSRTGDITFGPLQDGMIVHADLAPTLARQTALNAVAAVRGAQQVPCQRRLALIGDILHKFQQPGLSVIGSVFNRGEVV